MWILTRFPEPNLYKLDVYGPGSFFKAHRDTPQSEDMIGSLVVILPSEHTGGEITLEDLDDISWTFDAATKVAESKSTSAPLRRIHRILQRCHAARRSTLTYNLFLASHTNVVVLGERVVPAAEREFETALRALLDTSTFLPDGGLLAHGLTRQYPIPTAGAKGGNRIAHVLSLLKGSDARVRTVSERMGLETQVMMLYDSGSKDYEPLSGHDVLASDILDMSHIYDNPDYDTRLRDEIEEMAEMVLERSEERIRELKEKARKTRESTEEPMDDPGDTVKVHWVTKITETNRVPSGYMAYGNDPSIEHVYGNAALFVTVPAFGSGVRE
ncbi:Fe2OG dioxygenase domain-containing protein [Mycena sanguinolenta]|uniref:Fe2OG dioxygenase domain-containing protein n=1 Tax=Mycena sanguinolenta TaxID=230812 RepID=A0A8H7CYR2_9AGAR|nr:Fe2OG dioxygenase domain-containing protein [Mycena sanguinolenta]